MDQLGSLCCVGAIWCFRLKHRTMDPLRLRRSCSHPICCRVHDCRYESVSVSLSKMRQSLLCLGDLGALGTTRSRESVAIAVCANGNATDPLIVRDKLSLFMKATPLEFRFRFLILAA